MTEITGGGGQYHLAAEAVLLTSWLGFRIHSNVLEQNMFTMAGAYSGTNIQNRDRAFQLAVGNYNSLADYNEAQMTSRNFDRRYPETPDYQWAWESADKRLEYRDIRSRWDRTNQQLPVLLSLMVVNRVFSGLSAYNRAQNYNSNLPEVSFSYNPEFHSGVQAHISFSW